MQKTTKKTSQKKDKGLIFSHVIKSEKTQHYSYKLKNGQELLFKDKIFPSSDSQNINKSQLQLF